MSRHPHEIADRRSLLLHRRVAEHLARDPKIRDRARERVHEWRQTGEVAAEYANKWANLLDRSIPEIVSMLQAQDDEAKSLRQVSPFAGVLSARERWELLRQEKVEREHEAQ
jgi:hypothetical protein